MARRQDDPADDPKTAFPASEGTPGQQTSREAYAALENKRAEYGWWAGYLSLRAEGWDWRKAVYIAWEACIPEARWPTTQVELARQVLGLKNTSTIRHWKLKQPEIEKRIETLAVEMLGKMAMSQEEVLFRLTQQARASMGEFIQVAPGDALRLRASKGQEGEEGEAEELPAWTFDFRAIKARGHLIKSLKETQNGVSVTLVDSQGALGMLGRYYKLFTDRTEHDVPDDVKQHFERYQEMLRKIYGEAGGLDTGAEYSAHSTSASDGEDEDDE